MKISSNILIENAKQSIALNQAPRRRGISPRHCDDLPGISVAEQASSLWDKQVLDVALSAPHFCIADTIYFKNGFEILVTRKGMDGHYDNPEVVTAPAELNKVCVYLGCSTVPVPLNIHRC
ncbi:MAG: hypothetical protein ACLQF0_06640 [Dissulfurispiraceae bacterium]